MNSVPNVDADTIKGFGLQWRDFDQSGVPSAELERIFAKYFVCFPWEKVNETSVGLDAGCGSGRWAMFVAPRVGKLVCVDASEGAAAVARNRLGSYACCDVYTCGVEDAPVADGSLDFAYCLGVLHYVPDARQALAAIARKLKPGAPILVYVYYALDNRPVWFRCAWRIVDLARKGIARTPYGIRRRLTDMIAALIYFPLARASRWLEQIGVSVGGIPLSAYRSRSFYTMRTDCLDRFGNRLEHRFTRLQLSDLLKDTGFSNIVIPEDEPYWRAVAVRTDSKTLSF